ncbi:MAG: hypothetical protein V3R45_01310 [Candidatus Aminicenantaceae bacterium]
MNTIICKTATAPTSPAAVKATVVNACSTIGGCRNSQPVSSPMRWNGHTTGP